MKHYKKRQLDQLIKHRKEARKLAQNDMKKSNINFFFNSLFEDYNQTLINIIEKNEH
jgi:hypothetical protein